MAKHVTGLRRIGLWTLAILLVGVYLPSQVKNHYSSEQGNRVCALPGNSSPVPGRVWAIMDAGRDQWVTSI